jgi:hypothetical protein
LTFERIFAIPLLKFEDRRDERKGVAKSVCVNSEPGMVGARSGQLVKAVLKRCMIKSGPGPSPGQIGWNRGKTSRPYEKTTGFVRDERFFRWKFDGGGKL